MPWHTGRSGVAFLRCDAEWGGRRAVQSRAERTAPRVFIARHSGGTHPVHKSAIQPEADFDIDPIVLVDLQQRKAALRQPGRLSGQTARDRSLKISRLGGPEHPVAIASRMKPVTSRSPNAEKSAALRSMPPIAAGCRLEQTSARSVPIWCIRSNLRAARAKARLRCGTGRPSKSRKGWNRVNASL